MNYRKSLFFLTLVSGLIGCSTDHSPRQSTQQFIAARDDGITPDRPLLYRATVPLSWIRKDPSHSIVETTKENCEFCLFDGEDKIRITIHTFPISNHHPRIPPIAQIQRWKEQFDELDLHLTHLSAFGQGGFTGLFLEASGILNDKETTMMGWSMQLAPEYERQLSLHFNSLDSYKRADYTIKVVGPRRIMAIHRQTIKDFAKSFELIDELPHPL